MGSTEVMHMPLYSLLLFIFVYNEKISLCAFPYRPQKFF